MRSKVRWFLIVLPLLVGALAVVALVSRPEPAEANPLTGIAAVAAGDAYSCALTTVGGVKCWGHNSHGQLGNGTKVDSKTPIDVGGLTSGVAAVSAGGDGLDYQPPLGRGQDHACALTKAGGVKCWGSNASGQLGNGTFADSSTPIDVSGLTSGVAAVSAGGDHTCAVTVTGGVKCWGSNLFGELGAGPACGSPSCPTPVDVTGLTSGVAAVSAGYAHTCALTTAGGVKCWGFNGDGELGNGTITTTACACIPTPVDVTGLTSGAAAVSAAFRHTCALTTAGGVKCWGWNFYGQLGNGTATTADCGCIPMPMDVSGLTSGASAVSAGTLQTCALTTAGGVKCWGLTPVDVSGLTSGATAVSVGYDHTCALTAAGGVKCWGNNFYGQLGNGTNVGTPLDVDGLTSGVAAVSAGQSHDCALTIQGGVKCWGNNAFGQLGNGTTTTSSTPVDVSGLTSGVLAVSAGGAHTCAVTKAGGVKCWGLNGSGQLGNGSITASTTPVNVSGLTSGVLAVSTGGAHTCAVTAAGGVKCWGDDGAGQLGDGMIIYPQPCGAFVFVCSTTPVSVLGLTSGVAAVTAGGAHTCAVTAGGGVKCWGDNSYGELGNGTTFDSSIPVNVSGLTSGVIAVSAGESHTCGVAAGGVAKCWGNNYFGQLGNGTTVESLTPQAVSGLASDAAAISAGATHTCVLTAGGGVKCWGSNGNGELGNETATGNTTPVQATGLASGVAAVSAGRTHSCAVTTGGRVKCWGLGNSSATPVDVVELAPKPIPTPTPCPPGKAPIFGGCGTPTPTATPCPTSKVTALGGCGTPTPTATPCPTGKVPAPSGCGTPTPTPTPCGLIAIDDFANSYAVGSVPLSDSLSTRCATTQSGEPQPCAALGATVWYSYTPSSNQQLRADTIGSGYDTALAVYTGSSLNSLTLVGCDDDSGGNLRSFLTFTAIAGTTYHFQVGGCCGQSGALTFNLAPVPTPTPTQTPMPTPTPCPSGKVPSSSGCGTPVPPQCQPGDEFCLPGLDFSVGVGTQCDSTAGPTKCTFQTGQAFTLNFKLDSIPAGFSYDGYDFSVSYSGVIPDIASLVQLGPGVWPACTFAAFDFGTPGYVATACTVGVDAQPSTYVGTLEHMDFRCPDTPATAMVTLVSSPGATQVIDDYLIAYHQAADESLTINCVAAPPTPTATAAPPGPVGGISLDPGAGELRASSGSTTRLLAGIIAAVAAVVIAMGGGAWYTRRWRAR